MSQSMIATQPARIPAPTDSLQSYLNHIGQSPVLAQDREQSLARAWRDDQDVSAAQTLVLSNLRFVVHIARGYRGYGLPQADLIQEGNIGLMKAVKRFDPDVGVRLISFAVHWIKAEIHEYILRNWRLVKVATTKAQRKLFFHLRSAKQRLGWFSAEEVHAVAEDLGVPAKTVLEMESRLSGQDISYEPAGDEGEDASFAPAQYLADEANDPAAKVEAADWQAHSEAQLHSALETLDARSRDIIDRRWGSETKATLQELADEYGVSAERIRQIESSALKKMRAAVAQAA